MFGMITWLSGSAKSLTRLNKMNQLNIDKEFGTYT